MSKNTKRIAHEIDTEMTLTHPDLIGQIMQEEIEQMDLPHMSIDEMNEMYLEISNEVSKAIADELCAAEKADPDY